MLTERRARILGHIVDEYVNSAHPVGSTTVARKYDLAVSPATVRNEMMQLEEEGYIVQPHTSAGRMPSDKGYRHYVEALMAEEGPPVKVQEAIRYQFRQAAQEMEEWARLGASVLAHHVENAAVVTVPHSPPARLRLLELVQVQELLALLIVVLQEARVRQQKLPLGRPLGQDDLGVVARRLNGLFAGLTAGEIRQQGSELSQLEGEVASSVGTRILQSNERRHQLHPGGIYALPPVASRGWWKRRP
ncbi:MAG: HrcA family transcriptional regulator, partial [Dehalococcoidia bacterium]